VNPSLPRPRAVSRPIPLFAPVINATLLTDLLELTSHAKQPQLRNPHLAKELESLSKGIDVEWVMRAIAGFDELHLGSRRNLNRQLGLDALAASLAPNSQREVGSHR